MSNELIAEILELEHRMFTAVRNTGGPASCQQDRDTFEIMRSSQFEIYSDVVLESYLRDLVSAAESGRNLMTEKYARMMKSTHPDEYREIEHLLPTIDKDKEEIIERIAARFLVWDSEIEEKYPRIASRGRASESSGDSEYSTSKQTYLTGELSTYSIDTLKLIHAEVEQAFSEGRNMAGRILLNTVRKYGAESLESAEKSLDGKNRNS